MVKHYAPTALLGYGQVWLLMARTTCGTTHAGDTLENTTYAANSFATQSAYAAALTYGPNKGKKHCGEA